MKIPTSPYFNMATKKLSKYKKASRFYNYLMGSIFLTAIIGGPKLYSKINQRFDNVNEVISYNIQYAAHLGEEGKIGNDDVREYKRALTSLKLDSSYLEDAVFGVFRLDFSKPRELWDLLSIKDIKSSKYIKQIEREKDNLIKKVSSDRKY